MDVERRTQERGAPPKYTLGRYNPEGVGDRSHSVEFHYLQKSPPASRPNILSFRPLGKYLGWALAVGALTYAVANANIIILLIVAAAIVSIGAFLIWVVVWAQNNTPY